MQNKTRVRIVLALVVFFLLIAGLVRYGPEPGPSIRTQTETLPFAAPPKTDAALQAEFPNMSAEERAYARALYLELQAAFRADAEEKRMREQCKTAKRHGVTTRELLLWGKCD